MQVTPLRAATILVFAIASPLQAQGIEVSGGYSVNADYVQNQPAILVADQKVSPFFSHGSGPTGFELSFKRDVRKGLGIKVDVTGYSDTFRRRELDRDVEQGRERVRGSQGPRRAPPTATSSVSTSRSRDKRRRVYRP